MTDRPPGPPHTARLPATGSSGGLGRPGDSLHAGFPAESQQDIPVTVASSSSLLTMTLGDDIGKRIANRYEITDVIGEGGMGVVYEAWDLQVERKVAIKLVRSDTTDRKFISRFRRELEITSKLRHPSTIRVFEHGETQDGRPYMVMELLTGQSLAERLEQGPIVEMEALQIARQVAESLSEAHEHGVFHRDLKPDNIFIETVGVSKVVKVLDFGIAGGIDATRLTQAGEVFGTPQYMSPEQCNGQRLDHRTDIYSLACILYEMIEGRPPFAAETPMATMLKHVRAKVPAPRNASTETVRVILMGLRKDRTKRIQTAGRFSELIGECIGHLRSTRENPKPSTGPQYATGHTTVPQSGGLRSVGAPLEERRGKIVAIGLGVAALGLVVALLLGNFRPGPALPKKPSADGGATETRTSGKLPSNYALVRSNVQGAKVLLDGSEQCEAPCWIKVPVGDERVHEIRLTKHGFADVVQHWQPKTVSEELPKLPDMEPLE